MSGQGVMDELIGELNASAAAGALFEGEDFAQVRGERMERGMGKGQREGGREACKEKMEATTGGICIGNSREQRELWFAYGVRVTPHQHQ